MSIQKFTHRICPNCDRLVREHSDGEHHTAHACFTPSYLAGLFLGLAPIHLEQYFKGAIADLGIKDDEAFASGFHVGQEKADAFLVDKKSFDRRAMEEAETRGWRAGAEIARDEYEKWGEQCHCGEDCGCPPVELPGQVAVQPCHCGDSQCWEIIYAIPGDEERRIGTTPVRYEREQQWWEKSVEGGSA